MVGFGFWEINKQIKDKKSLVARHFVSDTRTMNYTREPSQLGSFDTADDDKVFPQIKVTLDAILFLHMLLTSVVRFVYSHRKRAKQTRNIFKEDNIVWNV